MIWWEPVGNSSKVREEVDGLTMRDAMEDSVCVLSCFRHVQFFVALWAVAHQASLPVGFSKQEYWSGLPCPPPGDLPDPGIEPRSPVSPPLQANSLPLSHRRSPRKLANIPKVICFHGILTLKGIKFFFGISMKYISTTEVVDFSIEATKCISQIVYFNQVYLTSKFFQKNYRMESFEWSMRFLRSELWMDFFMKQFAYFVWWPNPSQSYNRM